MAMVDVECCAKFPYQCIWCGHRSQHGDPTKGSTWCHHTGGSHTFTWRPIDIMVNGYGRFAGARFNQAMAGRVKDVLNGGQRPS